MREVFSEIATVIEDNVRDRKLRWMVAIPSAIGSLLVIVGINAGNGVLVNVSLACLAGFLGLVVIVMAIARRYMRSELGGQTHILRMYGKRIREAQEENLDLFHTTDWSEKVDVTKNGDSVIVRDITIRAGEMRVPAIWSLTTRNSEQHISASIHRRVRVAAHFLNENDELGARVVTSRDWEGNGDRLRVYMHFPRELSPKAVVRVRLTIKWPKYFMDLIDGQPEVNHWVFRRPTDSFDSVITFQKSFSRNHLHVTKLDRSPQPDVTRDAASGTTTVHLNLPTIEVDREYGYSLALSERPASA